VRNLDPRTAQGFDRIWQLHGSLRDDGEPDPQLFKAGFALFPLESLSHAEGFDLGCGNGRIARLVAPRVGLLHCIDPSPAGIDAAKAGLAQLGNARFHCAAVDEMPLDEESQDFGYSLGVLHHLPSPQAGLRSCVGKLKRGAPFLLYVYHDLQGRPATLRAAWRASDLLRRLISRMPFRLTVAASTFLAATLYWPLSRTARLVERCGGQVGNLPLSAYRDQDWATLRADSLDRFGTAVEHRFSKDAVEAMMHGAGLERVRFADGPPFWVAVGYKS
jgi:SAM-dependent methyltransferase